MTICLPQYVSRERKGLLLTYRAEVIETDPLEGSDAAIPQARQLASSEPDRYFYADQYKRHLPTAIMPGIYDPWLPGRTVWVPTEEAYEMTRRLARDDGLLVALSSGAAATAAQRVASQLERGCLVVILPDGAERYLSLGLWGPMP